MPARPAARRILSMLLSSALLAAVPAAAVDVFLDPERFLAGTFDGGVPDPGKLWLEAPLKERIHAILGADLGSLRVKYWARGARTAWILEAIGRDRPITAGFVVEEDRIVRVAVLIYRESRGWEVRYPFFTDQFFGAHLVGDDALDRNIDGITGATLSVRAITGLSKVALLLHREARKIAE
jgi:hypothetical protein